VPLGWTEVEVVLLSPLGTELVPPAMLRIKPRKMQSCNILNSLTPKAPCECAFVQSTL
jgi:hypothetical protein